MLPFRFVMRRAGALAEGFLVAWLALAVGGLAGVGLLGTAGANAETVLEGVLVSRHGDDFRAGRTVGRGFALFDGTTETLLRFEGAKPSDKLLGKSVRVAGRFRDGGGFLVAAGGTTQASGGGASGASTNGSRRVAVVLLNFSSYPSEPYTPSFARGVAFDNPDSVAAYYAESSWGKLTLSGDVFGWYTIDDAVDICAKGTWATSATAAAAADGVDLSTYDNVVYAFPYVSSCAWSGLATMPGRSSWLNGVMSLRVMAHELGHNFGTHHASSLRCSAGGLPVALSATCTANEYGDPFSVMGQASRYQPTNVSRGNFGWLDQSDARTITQPGDYALEPIEYSDAAGPQLLRLDRDGGGTYLTLEYRQPFGTAFDTFSTLDPVVRGVTLRLTGGLTALARTRLVDATPATTTFADATLLPGLTVVDPVSGISITTVSVSTSAAVVRIAFGPSESPTPAPTEAPTPVPTAGPTPPPDPTPGPTPTAEPTPGPDGQAPTPPGALRASLAKGKKISLTWSASSDNVAVAGYKVFRNGIEVGTASGTGFVDAVRGKSATYVYYIVAYDAAGNWSEPSPAVSITP